MQFLLTYFNSFFNKQLFFNLINKCQKKIKKKNIEVYPTFFTCMGRFVLPHNFIISRFCKSSLYLFITLNINLLLTLLMQIWIVGLEDKISFFYGLLDIILNIWHWIRTLGNSNLSFNFRTIFFSLLFLCCCLIFFECLTSRHILIYSRPLNLISALC